MSQLVLCLPAVGGIAVNEHFEINVAPVAVRITHRFYNTLMKFFFPDKSEPDHSSEEEASPALAALKGMWDSPNCNILQPNTCNM